MEDQSSSDESYVDSSRNEISKRSFQDTIDRNSNITYQDKQSTNCRIHHETTDQQNVKKKKWTTGDVENTKDCCDSETNVSPANMNRSSKETIRKEKVKKTISSPLSYRNLDAKSPQTNTISKWLNKYNSKSTSSSSSTTEVYKKECKENVGNYKAPKKEREFIEGKNNYHKSSEGSGRERKHKRHKTPGMPRKRNKLNSDLRRSLKSSDLPECDSRSPIIRKPAAKKLFVIDSSSSSTEQDCSQSTSCILKTSKPAKKLLNCDKRKHSENEQNETEHVLRRSPRSCSSQERAKSSPVSRKLFVMDSSFISTEQESVERIGSSLNNISSAVRSDSETSKMSIEHKSSKDKHVAKKCSGTSKLVLYDFLGVSSKQGPLKSHAELKSSRSQGKSDKSKKGQDRCVTPIKQRRIDENTEIRKSPRTKKKLESASSSSAGRSVDKIKKASKTSSVKAESKELMHKYLSKGSVVMKNGKHEKVDFAPSKRKRNESSQCKLPSSSSSVAKTTWLSKYSPRNKSDNAQGTSSRSPKSSKTVSKHSNELGKKRKLDDEKVYYSAKEMSSKKKVSLDETLDKYIKQNLKSPTKPKFTRSESNESCDLPSFIKIKKKDKSRSSDSFKKYGVILPSVEEILKEQKDLEQYQKQIESFKDVDDKFFDLPFSVKDFKNSHVVHENVLGCKHLSMEEIDKAFTDNLAYISDIFHGKVFNERHDRFFNSAGKNYTFTLKDLCYNTSTIAFTFDQLERLVKMMQKEFDPEDKWTSYFFQVLLPELCLKIFGDTHNMTHEEAVKYLDTRPVIDD